MPESTEESIRDWPLGNPIVIQVWLKVKQTTRSLSNMAEIGLNDAKAHQNIGKKNNPVTNIAENRAILQGLESSMLTNPNCHKNC